MNKNENEIKICDMCKKRHETAWWYYSVEDDRTYYIWACKGCYSIELEGHGYKPCTDVKPLLRKEPEQSSFSFGG